MIICSNCGATNNESEGRICRKCGALLPTANRAPRMHVGKPDDLESTPSAPAPNLQAIPTELPPTEKKEHAVDPRGVTGFFSSKQPEPSPPPKQPKPSPPPNLQDIPEIIEEPVIKPQIRARPKVKGLQEITPQPFQGSILAQRGGYGGNVEKPEQRFSEEQLSQIPSTKVQTPPKARKPESQQLPPPSDSTLVKEKRLKEDMSNIMSALSKKLSVPKEKSTKSAVNDKKETKQKIPPSSMSEIIKQLGSIDTHIEASAIIKTDGTILASATSNRISDGLFATVAQNLSMISRDIIDWLDAGVLSSVSLKGTEGVLDLAPIDKNSPNVKDMILIIFSTPKVKSGIINIATALVKKQIKDYLGIKE